MDQVYEIEVLRKRALDELRKQRRWMGTGEIAIALEVPTWAALPALESAANAGLAHGIDGEWRIANEAVRPTRTDQAGLDLEGPAS